MWLYEDHLHTPIIMAFNSFPYTIRSMNKFLWKSIVINAFNITLLIDLPLWLLIQPFTKTVNVTIRFDSIPSFLDVMILSHWYTWLMLTFHMHYICAKIALWGNDNVFVSRTSGTLLNLDNKSKWKQRAWSNLTWKCQRLTVGLISDLAVWNSDNNTS